MIAFAEDANYRAYTEATMLLFMNAVLLGPALLTASDDVALPTGVE